MRLGNLASFDLMWHLLGGLSEGASTSPLGMLYSAWCNPHTRAIFHLTYLLAQCSPITWDTALPRWNQLVAIFPPLLSPLLIFLGEVPFFSFKRLAPDRTSRRCCVITGLILVMSSELYPKTSRLPTRHFTNFSFSLDPNPIPMLNSRSSDMKIFSIMSSGSICSLRGSTSNITTGGKPLTCILST